MDISREELQDLALTVAENENIDRISFVGGEPLIYIEDICDLVELVRIHTSRNILLSMTTNGSLLVRNVDRLSQIGLNEIYVSFDSEHSNFLLGGELDRIISAAKSVCAQVGIVTTFASEVETELIEDVALKHQVAVQFVETIESGRYKRDASSQVVDCKIQCPNLPKSSNPRVKVSYIPKRGYTLCCGPLLFDHLDDCGDICKPDITALFKSNFYQTMTYLPSVRIRAAGQNSCEACVRTLRNPDFRKIERFFQISDPWKRTMRTYEMKDGEAENMSAYFDLRRIAVSQTGSFAYSANKIKTRQPFDVSISSSLNLDEIHEYRLFAIDTFFRRFPEHYSDADIRHFKSLGDSSFKRPFRIVRHRENGELKAVLLLMSLENYPPVGCDAWHVGYWGMKSEIEDPRSREAIKEDWRQTLAEVAKERPVTAIVDEFNMPAVRLAEGFGMDVSLVRFDLRKG